MNGEAIRDWTTIACLPAGERVLDSEDDVWTKKHDDSWGYRGGRVSSKELMEMYGPIRRQS